MAVSNQFHSGGTGQISTAAFPSNEDSISVQLQGRRLLACPMKARYAIVQAPGKRHHLRRRRGRQAVTEVDHKHGEALLREKPTPGLVVPIEGRPHHHAATVDVVNAGQHRVRVGADMVDFDGVAIGTGGELENFRTQPRLRHRGKIIHACEGLGGRQRFRCIRLRDIAISIRDIASEIAPHARHQLKKGNHPRVKAWVFRRIVSIHQISPSPYTPWTLRPGPHPPGRQSLPPDLPHHHTQGARPGS